MDKNNLLREVENRSCYIYETPIYGCMGFVRVGDFSRFLEGLQYYVRESCGPCTEKIFFHSDKAYFPENEQGLDAIVQRIKDSLTR